MREDTTILITLLFFYCFSILNSDVLKKTVPAITLVKELGWCSGEKPPLQINLGRPRTIAGVGSRKDDTITKFQLSYKENNNKPWRLYKENGKIKIFQVNEKSKEHYCRHWLGYKIKATYLKFHILKWQRPVCFHVEVYGWETTQMRSVVLNENERRSAPRFQELSMEQEEQNVPYSSPNKPTSFTKDEKNNVSSTIIICFLATGIIAILAMIIVCKWEKHERKITTDYGREKIRRNLIQNLTNKN